MGLIGAEDIDIIYDRGLCLQLYVESVLRAFSWIPDQYI